MGDMDISLITEIISPIKINRLMYLVEAINLKLHQ